MMVEILSQIFIFDHEKLLDEDAVTKKNVFKKFLFVIFKNGGK